MMLDFKVVRIFKFNGKSATKAMCDISINDDFIVKGFRIVEGKKGLFVSPPQDEGKDGKWYSRAFPVSEQTKEALSSTILSAYGGS
ncbi:MAG: septation protein SpoVG family protein [Candidatus Omnitrophota bacterium]